MAKTDFKMADSSQKNKKQTNKQNVLRTRNHQVKVSINIACGVLDQVFKVLGEEDISFKQKISCLAFRPSVLKK